MKLVILLFCVAMPVFAQIDGGDDLAFQRCRDRCDRMLESRQNIANSNYNITVATCASGNIAACLGCIALTAPPAVIACYITCGLVLPTGCALIIENAWNRYINELVLAGDIWADCLEACERECT